MKLLGNFSRLDSEFSRSCVVDITKITIKRLGTKLNNKKKKNIRLVQISQNIINSKFSNNNRHDSQLKT